MGCLGTLHGIGRACAANLAGVEEVYIADYDIIEAVGNKDTMKLDSVAVKSGAEDAKPFKTYKVEAETSSLTSTLTKATGGIHYYTHEVALSIDKMSADKHLELQAISRGACAVVTKDNNGKYWYCGADKYMTGEDTVAQAGQAFDDHNGYNTTLRGRSATMPFEIAGDVLTSFKALITEAPDEAE